MGESSFVHGMDDSIDSALQSTMKLGMSMVHSATACTYKIGDLGHATRVADPQVEDGDARYLAPEILDMVRPWC